MNDNLMNDNQMLYISSTLCFILILISFRYGSWFAIINLTVFCTYSLFFYYNLYFNNSGGSGFLWWFYLAITTCLELLIVGIYLGIKLLKKSSKP